MTDITIQLSNVIKYMMERYGVKEFEIPEEVIDNPDGMSIVAYRDVANPLNHIIKITTQDNYFNKN